MKVKSVNIKQRTQTAFVVVLDKEYRRKLLDKPQDQKKSAITTLNRKDTESYKKSFSKYNCAIVRFFYKDVLRNCARQKLPEKELS